MPTSDKYDLYDQINSTAVYWLKRLSEKYNKPLCIDNFDINNNISLWMLEAFKNYSLYNCYCKFYIKTNFFIYLYLRFWKKNKYLRYYSNKKDLFLVDCKEFAKELVLNFNENIFIIGAIYNEYYNMKIKRR